MRAGNLKENAERIQIPKKNVASLRNSIKKTADQFSNLS